MVIRTKVGYETGLLHQHRVDWDGDQIVRALTHEDSANSFVKDMQANVNNMWEYLNNGIRHLAEQHFPGHVKDRSKLMIYYINYKKTSGELENN
eukprot:11636831-Heterocapsa_arctica.AAC.1